MTQEHENEGRILVVDDDQDTRDMVASLLRKKNYIVYTAENGGEGLNILEESFPDLIICDVMMPEMDGFEFRNHIWQDPDLQLLPFIFLTAMNATENVKHALELYVDDYVTKPFDVEELLLRVHSKIEKFRLFQDQLHYDSLTKVFNRRFIITMLKREIERSRRSNDILSVCLLDIDDFKKVNDEHGHLVGDKVLADFASLLKNNLREYDSVGRYGGEEFLILMPSVEKKQALSVMERIKQRITSYTFPPVGLKITFSAGISIIPRDALTPKSAIINADKALYTVKTSGKNEIRAFR